LGVDLPDTKIKTLERLDSPVARGLVEYKNAAKFSSSYGRAWLKFVDEEGRIYATKLSQLGNDAGRSSCGKPNLQGVPKHDRYRRCFTAPAGQVLVRADYSQLHLRIICQVAKEKKMLTAYQNGEDLHSLTAASITGKDISVVTKSDRQIAKILNFGISYGMG